MDSAIVCLDEAWLQEAIRKGDLALQKAREEKEAKELDDRIHSIPRLKMERTELTGLSFVKVSIVNCSFAF